MIYLKRVKSQQAFTLIELVLSMGIFSLLSAIGLASYVQFNRRQILLTSTRALVNDLRMVQSRANSGEKAIGLAADCLGDLQDYKVVVTSLPQITYRLYIECASSPAPILIKEVTMPEVISKVSGFDSIKFKPLRQGVETSPQDQYTLILNAFGVSKTITAGKAGEITFE